MNESSIAVLVIFIDLILFSIVLFEFVLKSFMRLGRHIMYFLSRWKFRHSGVSVEIPDDEASVKPKYDVDAFRERMRHLQIDEDGLYNPPPEPVDSYFTGTEVLTPDYEIDLERRMGL